MNVVRVLRGIAALGMIAAGLSVANTSFAQKKYDSGASDTEIKIGNIMPYSGPASAYATIGKVEAAYFRMINDQGGINGRKINFISYDDGYAPPKAVEMTRKLVEQDEVLVVFNPLGTPSNTAIRKYLNSKKIPQLFVATGATVWNDPKNYPWTMGWQPNYQAEGKIYAAHVLKTNPTGKIGIIFQNDDSGRDYVKGFKDGLGEAGRKNIVGELSYEVTDPTVDSQIVALKSAGADIFFNMTTPKFAAMAIRKSFDIGWKPTQYLVNVSASVGSVLVPAGVEKAVGIISTQYLKDPTDKGWENDPAMVKWTAFMKKYYPEGDMKDASNVYGYGVAQTLVQALKQCGDDLTRENVMRQSASLKNFELDVLLPGIKINTSPDDFAPIESENLIKFDGTTWVRFGEVLGN